MDIENEVEEIKRRVREIIIDIIEHTEKAKLVGVSYGSLEKKYDRGIRVLMTSATLKDIHRIVNIVKSYGLDVENVHIYELNKLIAIEVFFDLKRGGRNVE